MRLEVSFRRRLTLAFVMVAAFAAGALAVGATAVVTSYRNNTFLDRARVDVQQDLALWDPDTPPQLLLRRLAPLEEPGGPGVIVLPPGQGALTSVEALTEADIPSGLRAEVQAERGRLVDAETSIGDERYLIIGQLLDRHRAEVYFFYSKTALLDGLRDLRVTLFAGWLLVTAVAAVVGSLVARRTLRPVQEAADAARSVTEGLLETRLHRGGDDEFGQWRTAFNEMVEALEDKIGALAEARDRERQFNADVAHELRTPLGTVVTAASILEERRAEIADDLRRPLELVVEGAGRLSQIVEELLELHTIESGEVVLQLEEVDVGEAIAAALHGHGWEDDVAFDAPRGLVVEADRRRLDRIITNLISNALRHGAPPVTVKAGRDGDLAVIRVIDHGDGVDADLQERIFDRYFKVSQARTSPGAAARQVSSGGGLGLAIARENAQLLDGSLELDDAAGPTSFVLRLPVRADAGGSARQQRHVTAPT